MLKLLVIQNVQWPKSLLVDWWKNLLSVVISLPREICIETWFRSLVNNADFVLLKHHTWRSTKKIMGCTVFTNKICIIEKINALWYCPLSICNIAKLCVEHVTPHPNVPFPKTGTSGLIQDQIQSNLRFLSVPFLRNPQITTSCFYWQGP